VLKDVSQASNLPGSPSACPWSERGGNDNAEEMVPTLVKADEEPVDVSSKAWDNHG